MGPLQKRSRSAAGLSKALMNRFDYFLFLCFCFPFRFDNEMPQRALRIKRNGPQFEFHIWRCCCKRAEGLREVAWGGEWGEMGRMTCGKPVAACDGGLDTSCCVVCSLLPTLLSRKCQSSIRKPCSPMLLNEVQPVSLCCCMTLL